VVNNIWNAAADGREGRNAASVRDANSALVEADRCVPLPGTTTASDASRARARGASARRALTNEDIPQLYGKISSSKYANIILEPGDRSC